MYIKGLEIIGDRKFLAYVFLIQFFGFWKLIDILVWFYKHISVSVN
jgi:hypothetical protein